MSVLVLPANVRASMPTVAEVAESAPIHKLAQTAVYYLVGEIAEPDLKKMARTLQIAFPTFLEAINTLSWVLCEAVRCKCTSNQFREFIAEIDFLNTPEILKVYDDSITVIKQCLTTVAPDSDHFRSLDWRLQVEVARRATRSIRRPHVVLNLKTTGNTFILEASPAMLCQLHETLDEALQACRTAQFRRIQRFVK